MIFPISQKVIDTYSNYNTKLSFTDAAVLEIMAEHNIPNLVTFDKEFKRCKEINIIN